MLFAAFEMDREPTRLVDMLPSLIAWLQSVGAIASFGLAIFFLVSLQRGQLVDTTATVGRRTLRSLAKFGAWGSWIGMAAVFAAILLNWMGSTRVAGALRPGSVPGGYSLGDWIFAGAGLLALLVVAFPAIRWLFVEATPRRIGAVARLSLKEALHGKFVLLVGIVSLTIILFIDWFVQYRADHQVRNYVAVFYWFMFPLFVFSAAVLGSFSLPNDIKNQTIHTVVTKPITKFEVVVGRFLGYAFLLTLGLFGVALLGVGYIFRGVTEEAKNESLKSRVATFGRLEFIGTKKRERGDSVGREDDRRSYIGGQVAGTTTPRQYAVWLFDDLSAIEPRTDGDQDMVRVEFTFDIFRLTKGEEGKGVNCTFEFTAGGLSAQEVERLASEARDKVESTITLEAKDKPDFDGPKRMARRAELWKTVGPERAVHQASGVEVTDYHTQFVLVPYALVDALRKKHAALPAEERAQTPAMQVLVSIDRDRASAPQMLGVARHDLYILASENWFWLNFLKGVVGMWCCVMVTLGIAVGLSTYLSGVITLITALFLVIAGAYMPSIVDIVEGRSYGGGPVEALYRIGTRTVNSAPLDESATTSLVRASDDVFRWVLARFLNLLPNIARFDHQPYVANGFDVPVIDLLLFDNMLRLIAYLAPWGLLAFYLIQFREIANPM